MFATREIVAAGGFLSYGASVPDLFRRGALYAHKILQGTKPIEPNRIRTQVVAAQPEKLDDPLTITDDCEDW